MGGLEDCSAIVFEVVKHGDFFLIVGNEDEVMVLAEVLHLAVHGSIMGHCFGVFCHVRLLIAFNGARPCRRCVFQEGGAALLGFIFYEVIGYGREQLLTS